MNFHEARFDSAYGTATQLPKRERTEIAFAGRSNVGKSSLLNALMHRKGLAKVSSRPGKTATINFYDVDDVFLVDLPGYGYAQVSKAERERWSRLMDGYFEQCIDNARDLRLVVSLIDVRHDPTALDRQMVEYLIEAELPFAIALTKCDKLSRQKTGIARGQLSKKLDLPKGTPVIATSAESAQGIEELRTLIEQRCC